MDLNKVSTDLAQETFTPAAWAGIDVPRIEDCISEADVKQVMKMVEAIRNIKERVFAAHECEGKALQHEAQAGIFEERLATNANLTANQRKLIEGQALEQRARAGYCWEKITQFKIEIEMYRAICIHEVTA